MRVFSLPHAILLSVGILILTGCGAKGDPRPNQRYPPMPCDVRSISARKLEVVLPIKDTHGNRLSGIDAIRIYYLSIEDKFPSALEVFQRGEPILERRRPDIPSPGKMVTMDLSHFGRSSGWLVVVAFRLGNVVGEPSQVITWLDPSFSD